MAELNEFSGNGIANHACSEDCNFHVSLSFHFTFFSGPNSTGGFASAAISDPSGPRIAAATRANCPH
jgi:hypothetical protein